MSEFKERMRICAGCPHRTGIVDGHIFCGKDESRRPIVEHARNNDCPVNRFEEMRQVLSIEHEPVHKVIKLIHRGRMLSPNFHTFPNVQVAYRILLAQRARELGGAKAESGILALQVETGDGTTRDCMECDVLCPSEGDRFVLCLAEFRTEKLLTFLAYQPTTKVDRIGRYRAIPFVNELMPDRLGEIIELRGEKYYAGDFGGMAIAIVDTHTSKYAIEWSRYGLPNVRLPSGQILTPPPGEILTPPPDPGSGDFGLEGIVGTLNGVYRRLP